MNRSISAVVENVTGSIRREVFVQKQKDDQNGSISILSPLYEPLQYPLLYFHGNWWLALRNEVQGKQQRENLSDRLLPPPAAF